ncbi:MAG: AraC family transcriptional regulator [Clostridia bacterium]|nr:AraC family transcriptional regulator [Clostridia bacterium]
MESKYVKNTLPETFSVRYIYTIHYFRYGKNFRFPSERHNFWEMVYIDGGSARIVTEKGDIRLKQGQAIFHAPNALHTINTDDDFANAAIISFDCFSRAAKKLENRIFNFGEREKALLGEIITEGSKTYREKLNDPHLVKMNKRDAVPLGSEQIIKNDIENLLILLVRKDAEGAGKEDKRESFKSEEIAEKIKEILKSRLYSGVTLEEISAELYFSKTYVKNVFKKYTGSSVIRYYIDMKMDEAKRLISTGKFSFTEIADKLGINSVHYFSRLFKQRTDMSPSEYAKSIKVDNLIK